MTGEYIGRELDIFAHARRWKAYWSSRIAQWIAGDVLEVGAGLGVNTAQLQNPRVQSWHCLEPDARLAERLRGEVAAIPRCRVSVGTTEALTGAYDSILYIDVLEHIEDDRGELTKASDLLRPGGRIVVLSPAHQSLYSPFDAAVGHCRRYDKASLRLCAPNSCRMEEMYYLDSAGMLLSLANRMLLRKSSPTLQQILAWDRFVIPVSRVVDPVFGYLLGKTIVGVWSGAGIPACNAARRARMPAPP